MNTVRSPRSTYVAAFLLGALIALLLVRPGSAAEIASGDQSARIAAQP